MPKQNKNHTTIEETAEEVKQAYNGAEQKRQFVLWTGALAVGFGLGLLGLAPLNAFFNFVATVFTRLFQFIAMPTIALTVLTTLASLGGRKESKRIFSRALSYTLLTTCAASAVGLLLYTIIAPGNLPLNVVGQGADNVPQNLGAMSYYDHIISVIPNNLLAPFIAGNVLSVLLVAAFMGLTLARMPESENKTALMRVIYGLQELLFAFIRGLLKVLPIGILAFAAQLAAQIEAGIVVGALGKYTAVVIIGNLSQMFVILPLFLLLHGISPLHTFRKMSPALAVALFTKSSAATLPVTMATAENNLKINPTVSRFVLPICTTINMNGCATFILVTSLFVMQNAGIALTPGLMVTWLFISVLAAVGNAGVPMGCYFLTLSLMSSFGAPLNIMGLILPIYAVIDMIETAENVWSDSTVCVITDNELSGSIGDYSRRSIFSVL